MKYWTYKENTQKKGTKIVFSRQRFCFFIRMDRRKQSTVKLFQFSKQSILFEGFVSDFINGLFGELRISMFWNIDFREKRYLNYRNTLKYLMETQKKKLCLEFMYFFFFFSSVAEKNKLYTERAFKEDEKKVVWKNVSRDKINF